MEEEEDEDKDKEEEEKEDKQDGADDEDKLVSTSCSK